MPVSLASLVVWRVHEWCQTGQVYLQRSLSGFPRLEVSGAQPGGVAIPARLHRNAEQVSRGRDLLARPLSVEPSTLVAR